MTDLGEFVSDYIAMLAGAPMDSAHDVAMAYADHVFVEAGLTEEGLDAFVEQTAQQVRYYAPEAS